MTVGWGGGDVQIQFGPRPPKFRLSGGCKFIVICTRQSAGETVKNSGTFLDNSRGLRMNFTGWFNK